MKEKAENQGVKYIGLIQILIIILEYTIVLKIDPNMTLYSNLINYLASVSIFLPVIFIILTLIIGYNMPKKLTNSF